MLFLFIYVGCNKAIHEKDGADTLSEKKKNVKGASYKKGDFVFSMTNLRKITRPRSLTADPVIQPTHLYMVFKPVTAAHYQAIEDKHIPVYPFPLATDSLDVSDPDYSTLYTFLPIKNAGDLPNCPYTLLDSVCLLNPESPAAALAYQAAGKVFPFSVNSGGGEGGPDDPCDPWEYCPVVPDPPIDPPPPPHHPEPLLPADNRLAPFTVTYNGCSMNTDENYPSGRITVEETQWGNGGVAYEGVADVRVEILGPMGQRVVAQTDRYGCFKATSAIIGFRPPVGPRLPVIMNVIFESDRKEIRGYNDLANLGQYNLPLKHIYGNISYSMNNANISYERNTDDQDNDAKYYVAATVNNALYEFDENAAADGILPPPYGIQILVHRFAGDGAAPMFAQMSGTYPVQMGTIKSFFIGAAGIATGVFYGDPVTVSAIATNIASKAPDVAIGYHWDADHFATDRIKEVAYHEFAHASHYRIADFNMWFDNIEFTVSHNGYGNAGDPGVEKTDLIEMWAYFLGREYAHRRYGPNAHSAIPEYFTNPGAPTFLNSWYAAGEHGGTNRRLFDWGHIPSYFLNDLLDSNIYNDQHSLIENPSVIIDSISNYKIATIYSFLDGSTTSPAILMSKLSNQLPAGLGNNIANFNLLRSYYGY